MARPKKQTVDYFPHQCNHKKTMYVLEQRYGNDGYAFWFKLLELLGDSEGHYLDLNDDTNWEFLQAKTRLDDSFCTEILDLLAKLGAIDKELWENRVVWSQNFVDGIADVYRNRKTEVPTKPNFYNKKHQAEGVSTDRNPDTAEFSAQSTPENPQSKVKESKVNNTTPPSSPPSEKKEPKFFSEIKDLDPVIEKYPRYSKQQQAVIRDYWAALRFSRQTARIALSVIEKEMDYWEQFPADLAIEALEVHVRKYQSDQSKGESYTRGIMRRLRKERELKSGNGKARASPGCDYENDAYDDLVLR